MYFGNGVNPRVIYGILIALCVYSFLSMSSMEWFIILITLPAVIFAIAFHEFSHALAAVKLGDTTPKNQGRLTLNPLVHLDWMGFLLMLFAHIGWGKPVQINPNNFTSNKSRGTCEMIVALAGPLSNFVLAIIFSTISLLMLRFADLDNTLFYIIYQISSISITVNIGLGVFNLIPLPPLDGEKIFRNMLPYKVQEWLTVNYQTLYVVFLMLWFFGILEVIVAPVIEVVSDLILKLVASTLSLFIAF